jgi:hypothetical protein
MTSSWLFPPRTCEVQLDEKWSFVGKKQKNCDPLDPADDHKGDWWDHVAYDPEHRLVLAVVPGARSIENAEAIVTEVKDRTGDVPPRLMTAMNTRRTSRRSQAVFGTPEPEPPRGPGRRRSCPNAIPPRVDLCHGPQERERNRVISVERRLVAGTESRLDAALEASSVSRAVNTSVRGAAARHGPGPERPGREYWFSKDWRVHEAMPTFTLYRYSFLLGGPHDCDGRMTGRWQHEDACDAARTRIMSESCEMGEVRHVQFAQDRTDVSRQLVFNRCWYIQVT